MLVTSMGAYSGDVGNDIAIIITAQEDRAAIHAQQIEDTMLQLESERTPTHLYKHIAAPIQYVTVEGFAGGQNKAGYKFPTINSGFTYTPDNGPIITKSISVAVGVDFKIISIDVELGMTSVDSGAFGQFIGVPNTRDFFKLNVIKTNEVQPYIIYRKSIMAPASAPWEYYMTSETSTEYTTEFELVKMN